MESSFYVSLSVAETMIKIEKELDGDLIDKYVRLVDEIQLINMCYEKYSWFGNGRNALIITIDNLQGKTKIHAVTVGGEGMFRWDVGAPRGYIKSLLALFNEYKIY